MKKIHHRFLCALCALAVLISALFPVSVLAAEGTDTAASAPSPPRMPGRCSRRMPP